MGCNHNNINCGCKDNYLTTPPACPTPVDCPDPQPCSEVFDAQCIQYTGADILCNNDTVVTTNTNVADAINDIVTYLCENNGANPLVQAGDNITVNSTTVGSITTYTVIGKETIVAAGTNVTVTSVTVGNDTTYTVNAACPIDVTIIDSQVVPRGYFADVTGGTAPYTYTWSFADNGGLAEFTTANSLPDIGVGLNGTPTCRFNTGINQDGGTISLLKVTVVDANGCIAKDTFLWIETDCSV